MRFWKFKEIHLWKLKKIKISFCLNYFSIARLGQMSHIVHHIGLLLLFASAVFSSPLECTWKSPNGDFYNFASLKKDGGY